MVNFKKKEVEYRITRDPFAKQNIYDRRIATVIWQRKMVNDMKFFCLAAYSRNSDSFWFDFYEWLKKHDEELKKDFLSLQ